MKKFEWPKICLFISKSSRRDTIIVNCQLSIVNSAKPFKHQFPALFAVDGLPGWREWMLYILHKNIGHHCHPLVFCDGVFPFCCF